MHFSNIIAFASFVLSLSSTDATPDQIEKIYFGGRWWRDRDTMRHSWGLGTFIVRFQGSSSLVMNMGAALDGAFYTCQVDNGLEQRILVSNSIQNPNANGMTFTDLSSTEEHVIRCGRNNEASYGDSVISGITLEDSGQLLQAIDPNANNKMIRFEAIGDSITAGYKVLVPPGVSDPATIANQDVFHSYIRFMADAWGTTDYQVIAKSGVSILDYGTTGIVMPQEWLCREYWAGWEGGCPALWDFGNWQADVVVINLGTNDFAFGNPTQLQFRQGYLSFVQQVRSKYPNALIACIEPIQHSCSGESFPVLTSIVNGLEQAVNDMNDPKVIYYETGSTVDPWLDCTLSTQDFMDFTHPTVQGNEKFASGLLEKMTNDVRQFFPNKCGGAGPTCGPGTPTPPSTTSPISSPFSTPSTSPISSPVPPSSVSSPSNPSAGTVVCTATPQNQLPDGEWATTDEQCEKCGDGYQWWPCDSDLCQCSPMIPTSPSEPTPVSSPVSTPTTSPVSSPVSPVSSPVSTPSSQIACTAVPQNELPNGQWAITNNSCKQCEEGYEWWPCDTTAPSLCKCTDNNNTRRARAMLRSGK